MMVKASFFCGLLFLLAVMTAGAQAVHTPEKGSAERKAILDALRIPVEKDLRQQIVFVSDNFSVTGVWAFLGGSPRTKDGGTPDYRKTQYAAAVESGAFDNNFFALLKKTGGKWKVVTYAIGCTDVCYADWWRRYRAPRSVFPYTE